MHAFVTLVTNADYALGALALARSLRQVGSRAPLVVLATDSGIDLEALLEAGCEIVPVSPLPLSTAFKERHSRRAVHERAPFDKGEKPVFHDPLDNFSKLRLWQLTQYQRVVFLDADTLVVRNIDRLFDYPEFCGAPNLYESLADMHRLNSGVFVARPDLASFDAMLAALDTADAVWRRTDQTFLETYFADWHGLPYTYNTLQYVYFNLPQLWHWPSIRVVHYQYEKPWMADHPKRAQLQPLIDLWHGVLEGKGIPRELAVQA
ncbi:MAG: glycosyltransferase family 8 protein [Pseudomonadales bacterium]